VYHRVETNEYAALLTYRQLDLHTTWDNLEGPTPATHITRFGVRADELLNSKYGRSATGAERPILIPSKYCLWGEYGYGSVTELTEAPAIVARAYRSHKSSGRVQETMYP